MSLARNCRTPLNYSKRGRRHQRSLGHAPLQRGNRLRKTGYGSWAIATMLRPLEASDWMLCVAAAVGGDTFQHNAPETHCVRGGHRTDQHKCRMEGVWELEAGHTYAHAEAKCSNCRGQRVGRANSCAKEREARQAGEGQRPPPATTQSMAMSGGRGNGRKGESRAAKACTGWVQQNGRVRV